MKTELIITHPGSAHFDEVTAISLILAMNPTAEFKIERREPKPEELDNPEVWVIDTGKRYQPEKHNFDHHQDMGCPASFVLVAEYYGLAETMSILPWWNFKDEVDRFGPVKSSVKYHAGDDLVNRNPMEIWLTSRFAAEPDACLFLLTSYGNQIIRDARVLKKQIDFWKKAKRLIIAGVPAMIGETAESAGLEEFRRLEKNPPDIVISLARRDGGWRLFRYEGAPVDFSLLADRPEIAFAHKSGFMAATKDKLGIEELIALITGAVTK